LLDERVSVWHATDKTRDEAADDHGRRWSDCIRISYSILSGWSLQCGCLGSRPAFSVGHPRKPQEAPEANRPWAGGSQSHWCCSVHV